MFMKKSLLCLFALIVLAHSAGAFQVKASGVVLDSAQDTLIGVSVLIEGTTTGTITNGHGQFTLTCPVSSQLVFSLTGYQTQILSPSTNMHVIMVEEYDELDSGENDYFSSAFVSEWHQ
jgi:hypothetical protein